MDAVDFNSPINEDINWINKDIVFKNCNREVAGEE